MIQVAVISFYLLVYINLVVLDVYLYFFEYVKPVLLLEYFCVSIVLGRVLSPPLEEQYFKQTSTGQNKPLSE